VLPGSGSVGNTGPSWHVEGDSSPYNGEVQNDFYGEGYSDILFQNRSGEPYI
jgi:hypothetical protein